MKLCFLGIHRFVYVGIFTLRDVFGEEHSVSLGVCRNCTRCQWRFVRPQSAGDVVDWALRFEGAMKDD